MTLTAARLATEAAERENEAVNEVCPVCYTNELISLTSVKLTCEHTFCRDCFQQAFRGKIEDGQVNDIICLDFECRKPVERNVLKEFLPADLFDKFDRFKAAKALEGDLLIRFCNKPGC